MSKQSRTIFEEHIGDFTVRLTVTGKLFVRYQSHPEVERPWYKDPATRQPWIPRQSSFIVIMKEAIRSGKFSSVRDLTERDMVAV